MTGGLRSRTGGERAREGVAVQLRWRLKQVMASREVWSGKQLRELLVQRASFTLSAPSISALMNNQPVQMKTETLQALCTALKCTPDELYGVVPPREISLADEPDKAESSGR
jgi:putative transcriptional regulator